MSAPLFTVKELSVQAQRKKDLEASRNDQNWNQYWKQIKALERAQLVEQVKRAQARPQEFLNGLLLLIGSRGSQYLEFEDAFAKADDPEVQTRLRDLVTPEVRRNLYTILKALTEVPKSWATSAFIRFLRGVGKQEGAKYHGAGTFGVLYGWKEKEISTICKVITSDRWGGSPYAEVLMSYADVQQEIYEAEQQGIQIDYGTEFVATRVERDKEFLNKLCEMLDKQGLGPIPTPSEAKPKKERKIKQFNPGDVIKKTNIRDLPLPAQIRFEIEKLDKASNQWIASTLEQVVITLRNDGYYDYAMIIPGTQKAYQEKYVSYARKVRLEGATYLGKWTGSIAKEKTAKLDFEWRPKGGWHKHNCY